MKLNTITENIQYGILSEYETLKYHQLRSLECTPIQINNTKITSSELREYSEQLLVQGTNKSSLSFLICMDYLDLCDFEYIAREKTLELHSIAYVDYDSIN